MHQNLVKYKVVIAVLFALLLWGCSNEGDEANSLPTQPDDGLRSEVFGARFVITDSSRLQAILKASRVIEKEEKETEDAKPELVIYLYDSVHIEFFNARERPESNVTSQNGIYWKDKKLARLTGNVILINKKGEKLESEELYWDEKNEKIYTKKYVRVQTADRIVTGDSGLVSNSTFTEWEVKGNIKAEYEYDEDF
ncbi:LPS export ABC transporter periplasmic protein LptC, partial [bacterium]|nr:LPS export ABC transporter periplasmic protein LptC [bacterium]